MLSLLLAASLWIAPVSCPDEAAWVALVRAHRARYPAMQPADAYKLLHQATLGSEHAIASREMAAQWLARELATLPAGPGEPLVDTLGTGGFARIHLRPFLAQGGEPDSLLSAFVLTASTATRDTAQLSCALAAVQRMVMNHETHWDADSVSQLFTSAAAGGYPAMHHSDTFTATYHPAYRVVSVSLITTALLHPNASIPAHK